VVHEPLFGRTWAAVRDGGAVGPDGPLRLCPDSRLARPGAASAPTLAWLQGYSVRSDPAARALRLSLESGSRRLIQLWSPLLCWVMLSRGAIDGFIGYRAGLVDLPAGSLIAREAGVQICDFDGVLLDDRFDRARGPVDFIAAGAELTTDLMLLVKAAAEVSVSGLPE
jgi:myo-inositol-1(or 4)-monophosphatase